MRRFLDRLLVPADPTDDLEVATKQYVDAAGGGGGGGSTTFRGARAYRDAALSIPDSTTTAIELDAESHDTDDLHDNATNPSRIRLDQAGKWAVIGQIAFDANSTGARSSRIHLNGTLHTLRLMPGSAAGSIRVNVADVVECATPATDYVELYAHQDSGGSLSILTGSHSTFLVAYYLGDGEGGAAVEGARLTHSTTFSAANGAFTTVPFDTETEDDAGWHDTATDNSRITVATAGWVDLAGAVELPADGTGQRVARILLNGVTEVGRCSYSAHGTAAQVSGISAQWKASAGDYFELQIFQNSGGALTANGNGLTRFSAVQAR